MLIATENSAVRVRFVDQSDEGHKVVSVTLDEDGTGVFVRRRRETDKEYGDVEHYTMSELKAIAAAAAILEI